MKTDLWMPWFLGDYLRDTMHLTTEQHGAYLLLIGHYWVMGRPLPDDDEYLASVTKLGSSGWLAHRPRIAQFFQIADGKWVHKRIEAELKRAKKNKESRVTSAMKAASARWGRKGDGPPRNPPRMPDASDDACLTDTPPPPPSDIKSTHTLDPIVPTAEEIVQYGQGPPAIPEEYCRRYHNWNETLHSWLTRAGELKNWKKDITYRWEKQRATWRSRTQSAQSQGEDLKRKVAQLEDDFDYVSLEKQAELRVQIKALRAESGFK